MIRISILQSLSQSIDNAEKRDTHKAKVWSQQEGSLIRGIMSKFLLANQAQYELAEP